MEKKIIKQNATLSELFEQGRAVLKRTALDAWEMGGIASAVKERLAHGEFAQAIKREWGLNYQSARNFINVFEKFPDLPQKLNNLSFDVAPTVLYLLAESNVSDEQREEIVAGIEAGEIAPTVANIKAKLTPPAPENYAADNAQNDDISDETPVGDDDIESYGDVVYAEDESGNEVTPDAGSTPATPQEQYAAATVVSDTITQTPSEADENDLTDNEWLMTAPLFKLLVSRGEKALLLRGDMLAWRTMQQSKAFGAFRHHAQKAFNFNNAHTPLSALIYKATHVKHPRDWGGCVTCRGKGCTECRYTGAQLEGGLTIEQMEAR